MPNFNFLPNNKSNFPHIDNIDTYKYDIQKLNFHMFQFAVSYNVPPKLFITAV